MITIKDVHFIIGNVAYWVVPNNGKSWNKERYYVANVEKQRLRYKRTTKKEQYLKAKQLKENLEKNGRL